MSTKQNRRFTLIELLMVIAVIAILASLLLPALRKGRNLAKGIECLGRKKQIGIATQQYLADNNDTYYSSCIGSALAGNLEGNGTKDVWAGRVWTRCLMNYLGIEKFTNSAYSQKGIFGCPSLTNSDSFYDVYSPVGYNDQLFGYYPDPPFGSGKKGVTQSKIRHPARTLTHGEPCYNNNSSSSKATRSKGNLTITTAIVAYRHSRKSNIIFADGHVSPEPAERLNVTNMAMLPWNNALTEMKPVKYNKFTAGYSYWDD